MIRNNQNRRRRGGNGPRPQQMTGGNNYGNRLDNRQRGNASQLLEKYRALARDSQQAGDRVTAEYYLQYAEHYFRLLGDHRDRNGDPVRRPRDEDEEFGDHAIEQDDGETEAQDQREPEPRREEERNWRSDRNRRDDRPQERAREDRDRPREDRPREDRPREERARDDRPRDDRPREDRQREPRRREWNRDRDDRPRDERPRDDRVREDRAIEAPRREVSMDPQDSPIPGLPGPATLSRRSRKPVADASEPAIENAPAADVSVAVLEPQVEAADAPASDEAPAPRRRGRPRKVVA